MIRAISHILVCCTVCGSAGCQALPQKQQLPVLPADKAPVISLRRLSPSIRSVSLSDRASPVDFVDERPEPERRYYPGLSQLHCWQDSISMLPLEAFTPGIEEQIQAGLSARCPGELAAIQIQLKSFQFALDEREETRGVFLAHGANRQAERDHTNRRRDQRAEKNQKDDDERQKLVKSLHNKGQRNNEDPSDEHTSWSEFVGEAIGQALFYVVGTTAKVLLIEAPRSHWDAREARRQTTPAAQQTPELITREKQSGLNCRIEALITCSGNAPQQPLLITVCRNVPRNRDVVLQVQIAQLVEDSIDEFCDRAAAEMVEEHFFAARKLP